ncbi:MAG: hypothetical protein K1X28_05090 [Parachlamydiales bacterium]|nr:hypothetical protein [Parachlamydiales bacterium]
MVPSFVTIQKTEDEQWIVVQRNYPVIHGQVSFAPDNIQRSEAYETQEMAMYKAGEVSLLVKARLMGINESFVLVVRLGNEKSKLFVPAILRADGNVILAGDGMTADLESTIAKARRIAEEKKIPFNE